MIPEIGSTHGRIGIPAGQATSTDGQDSPDSTLTTVILAGLLSGRV